MCPEFNMEKISHAPASFSFFKQKQFVGSLTVVRTVACVTQRDDPLFFNKNHMLNKWESKSWSNISIFPITHSLQLLLESICAYNSHNSTFEGLLQWSPAGGPLIAWPPAALYSDGGARISLALTMALCPMYDRFKITQSKIFIHFFFFSLSLAS